MITPLIAQGDGGAYLVMTTRAPRISIRIASVRLSTGATADLGVLALATQKARFYCGGVD